MPQSTIASLSLLLLLVIAPTVAGQEPPLDQTLAEVNERFQNVDVKLIEWPDELHKRLGELKKIAFMATPVKETSEKLPLLITLHGGGETKLNIQQLLVRSSQVKGLSLAEAAGKNLILLEPNSAASYDPKTLNIMLDYVLDTYDNIDRDRVYVMGHSMGGLGTWNWINHSPERFAAAAPCGFSAGETGDVSRLTKLPVCGMVGGADGKNVASIKTMVQRLKDAGNPNVKYIEFPGANHGRGNVGVFSSVEAVDWMLSFSCNKTEKN